MVGKVKPVSPATMSSTASSCSPPNNNNRGAMLRSPNQPRLRRKAPLSDTLNESSTAVQRLVEYFCIVSSQPRWTTETTTSDRTSTEEPTTTSLSKGISSLRKRRRTKNSNTACEAPLPESRQESPQTSTHHHAGTPGNIHMPLLSSGEHSFSPQITARYPYTDYQDNPLNPMILQFCYPSGDFIVPSRTYELPRVHHFVLTNERGRKVYGTCLTVFEEYHASLGPWRSSAYTQEPVKLSDGGIEVSVDQQGKQALYLPKVLVLLSTWPYLTAFKEYLSQLYRLASTTNVMTAPIERYVVNICTEIPAPPPGAYEVQVDILNSTIRFWAPPAKLPLSYVALPFQILFDCLDVEHVLLLWSALIVERKVLLLSTQYSILTICSEILCSLLFPMRWSHLYVPLLPRMLCPMLDAPVPYLCGIARENWLYAEQFVSHDTIVVDLDHNRVMFGSQTPPIPPLPPRKSVKLQTTLLETIGHLFWKTRGLEKEYRAIAFKKPTKRSAELEKLRQRQGNNAGWVEKLGGLDFAFNLAYTPDSKLLDEAMSHDDEAAGQSKWDKVQEAFVRFFVAILKDYRKYLILPPTNAIAAGPGPKPSFDRISFLAAQKVDVAPFLMEMCMTQQFDDFITRRMYSPGEPDLEFFDQSINAKLNRSRLKLRKIDTPLLQSAKAHKVLKKFNAVAPNTDSVAEYGDKQPYVYKTWPERFDEGMFTPPRPIPKMIAAEFDRQAILVSRLRADIDDEDEADLLEFYGGDYDASPEVAAFTVFLFAYSALVGLDWQDFEKRRREEKEKLAFADEECRESPEGQQQVVDEEVDENGRNEKPVDVDQHAADGFLSDLTMGFCDSCPPHGFFALKSTLSYFSGAEDAYSNLFQKTADQVAELQHQISTFGSADTDDKLLEALVEYEEAKEVASAQLDLAFEALSSMGLRGLAADSDAYKSLMEACGRCGDTQRALKLMELMKLDGFAADSEILACFVAAFAHDTSESIDIGSALPAKFGQSRSSLSHEGTDAYSIFLKKNFDAVKEEEARSHFSFTKWNLTKSIDESETQETDLEGDSLGSDGSQVANGSAAFLDWFNFQQSERRSKKKKKRRKAKSRKSLASASSMQLTDMLANQLDLGENLLDFLYPELAIDTNSDSCPHCSYLLSENDIVAGWVPCSFHDYTTNCPRCKHRFVPRFVVTCASPTFEGSQGHGTPLQCEFLSPWVIRKALHHVIKGEIGIRGMLHPEWRNGIDIRATLFWNLMVLCRRYRLPFTFLLQGSFQNRLILPRKPEEV